MKAFLIFPAVVLLAACDPTPTVEKVSPTPLPTPTATPTPTPMSTATPMPTADSTVNGPIGAGPMATPGEATRDKGLITTPDAVPPNSVPAEGVPLVEPHPPVQQ